MRMRWILATVGASALAVLTMNVPLPWVFQARQPAGGAACPANAKTANLNFTMKDMTGTNVKLADYKGKVILLDFWATWCGPCKFEIPGFVELQQKYGKDGLQVIGVSVDDTIEKMVPFVKELKMNYPALQGLGHDDVQEAYGPIWGIPISVIISRDGKICARHTGMATKEQFEHEIKLLL